MKEIWKPVVGYEKSYEVSNHGRVRSLDRTIIKKDGKKEKRRGIILKACVNSQGYYLVRLCKDSKKSKHIHRLVAQAFIPNPLGLHCVNHIDADKKNNCVDNLEWCNISYNTKHAYQKGLIKVYKGEANIGAKLTWEQVKEIRRLHKPFSREYGAPALAKKYGVSETTIKRILSHLTYKE